MKVKNCWVQRWEHQLVLEKAIEYAINQQEVRFISPNIGRYLDWISKVKKIPRSVYLRALIERDMKENTEFEDSN
jgi:hypothetical protein